KVSEGDTVKRTGKLLEIPVGEGLLGRLVDPLGRPLDDKGEVKTTENPAGGGPPGRWCGHLARPLDDKGEVNPTETRSAEHKAPGVVHRQPVKEPMQTGLKAIDSMITIGRCQRELIVGDRPTGQTAIAVDTVS